ncbi:MAG: hypothetical protein Q7T26_01840 [Dehalococcoidia bacterium]|nr:hypothetical protein [Dehalococcoidia bacterium]
MDINFIPPAYRRESLSKSSRQYLILCCILLVGLVYLFVMFRAQQKEMGFLELRRAALEKQQVEIAAGKSEFDKLQDAIKVVEEKAAGLAAVQKGLPTIPWGRVLQAIGDSGTDKITLGSLVQQKRNVTISGLAADFPSLVEYGTRVKASLDRQGLPVELTYRQAGAAPPPVLVATPVPRATVTPTPTPIPGIAFVLVVTVTSGGGP